MANVNRKFNFRKFFGVTSTVMVMSLIMIQFQNCAPAPMQEMAAEQSGATDQMRVVDDWKQDKLLFVQPEMVVDSNEEDVFLYGVCDRKSSDTYQWVVTDEEGQQVQLSGTSFCEGGGFKLVVDNLKKLGCDQDFKVHVASDNGSEDMMTLTKHCTL